MNTLLNIIFIFVLIIPLYAQNNAPEITGQEELSTPEDTPLTITFSDLSVEDVDNTYPDDFTLTVLEGDNYTIEGGSGGENSDTNPFEDLVTPNPSSGVFLAQATIDGTPAGEGDWSAAFDEDGNIAGAAAIMINAGTAYINMPIYGDDTTTPDVDEGMNAGESFTLKIWDSSTGDILDYPESFDCWYNNNGGPMNGCGNYTEVYDFPVSAGGDGNTIIPDENFVGNLTVPVFVDDGEDENSQSNIFDLIVIITQDNDAPTAHDIEVTTSEDTPVEVPVSGSDIDGDALTFELVDFPQHGIFGPNFHVSLNAAGGGQDQTLMLGFSPALTDDYDAGFDSYAPPAPPPPAFDAALGWAGDRYYTQIVEGSPDDVVEHVWDIQLQYPADNLITLTWDNTGLSDLGTFLLQDAFDGALGIDVDMSVENSLVLDNPAFNILKLKVTPVEVWTWIYTPEENYYGSDGFTYRAFDGELFSDEAVVNINISALNDPPELAFIGNQETDEDVPLTIVLSASDVDSPELFFDASSDNESVTVSVVGDQLIMTPAPDYFGTANITVTVSDGESEDSEIFELIINSVNDPPFINLPGTFTFYEDSSLVEDFENYVGDVDEDPLVLTVSGNVNITVQIDGLVVTFGTLPNFNGTETVTFTVDDSQGISFASYEVNITVLPVNDPPELASIHDQEMDENQILLLDIIASDVEGDVLYYDAESSTDMVEAKMVQSQLKLTPALNWNGTAEITVTVNDGFLADTSSFELTVVSVNSPPEVVILRVVTNEDIPVEVNFFGSDTDGDSITFEVVDEPSHGTVTEGVYTPDTNFNGEDLFTYRGFDETDYSDPADVVVTVFPVNDAPVLSEIGNLAINEDEVLEYTLTAEDVDGDALVYDASSLSENIEVKVTDVTLTVTPETNWNGTADITVTVSDGFLTDMEIFTLTVNPVNDAPVAEDVAIFPSVPLETQDLELSYIYTDIEGDPESGTVITWYKNGVEQGEFADQLTIPSSATLCDEVWHAIVTPSDGTDVGESEESNHVTICGENSPPGWSDIDDEHIDEDSGLNELDISDYINDNEQAPSQMVFAVTSNPDPENLEARFSSGSTLQLTTLTEDYFSLSPIILTLTVNDGEYTVETTMNVYIDPVNDAPILDEIGSQVTNEDIPLSLSLSADDVDEDELSFDAFSEYPDFVSVSLEGSELTLTPAEDFYGDVQINVSVTDGEYSDSEVFTLIVLSINDAPTIDLPESVTFDEDGSYTEDFSVYIDDIDYDELSLSVTGGENVLVEINGFIVMFTSNDDWNGTETLTFMVDDAQGRAVATDDIDVVVIPVNDDPVLTEIGNQETSEDISLVLTLEATDVDEDDLIFNAVSAQPENVTAEVTGNQLTLSPVQDWYGTVNIFVSVSDGELDDLENFDLTVNPVNDAPVIDSTIVFTTLEEIPLEITFDNLMVTDVDNVYPDDFTLTVLEGENYTVAGTTITPVLDFFGELTVPVYIDDGGLEYSQSDIFDLFIEVINVNDAPVLTEIGDQETFENNPLEIALSALDVDEDNLTYSAFSYNPNNVTAVMDGETLTLTPADNWNGTVTIMVTISDGLLGDSEEFDLTVISVNNPPDLTFIGNQDTDEDVPLTVAISASDVEEGELDFSVSSDNDAVAVSIDSVQLTMTPDPNYFGTANITVSVSDGFLTAEETFVLTINPVPDAPVALMLLFHQLFRQTVWILI